MELFRVGGRRHNFNPGDHVWLTRVRNTRVQRDRRSESLSRTWWTVFLSRDSDADLGKDFFAPTITGSIELAVFPLLIVLATWSPIAWWLTIKTAVQWERWKRADRTSYNRFVVGNALVIGASVFLTHLIKIQLAFLQDFAP